MKTWVRISFVVALAFVFLGGTLAALGTGSSRQTVLAWGNTLYVDAAGGCGGHTPCYTTVQAAVDAATTGDEIRVAAGVYTGVSAREGVTQVVYISKTVTVQGGYTTAYTDPPDPAFNPTVLNAAGQGRVVYIVGSITPTLAGLRLTGGNATGLGGYYDPNTGRLYDGGGAVYAAYATPTITNCQIDNSGAQAGGGIALYESPLHLYNSRVLTNQAGYGGGLAIGRAAAIVSGNLFADNQAGYAGGIGAGQSAAQITNNTIRANTAISSGGGIALIGNPPATVRGNLITANSARWGGGIVISSSTALVENNTITANHADEVGGGVNLDHCNATIANNLVQQNDAGYGGGGFYFVADTAVVTGNQVLSNTTPRKGGGLYVNESAAQVINNTIAGNTASGTAWDESGGGGVYVRRSNGVWLRGNAILANAALMYGGGVRLYQSAATLESNTIATNTVDTQNSVFAGGGGIYADGAPLLISNTVRANVAYGTGNAYGGGIYLNNSDATLRANAIVSNTARTSGMGSSASGGGVYGDGGAPTLTANEILSNTTVASGGNPVGGGVCLNNATVQIADNVVAFNRSPVAGGLYLGGTAGTVAGNRIYENSGSVYAGGMYIGYGANLIQQNVVLSNTAPVGGGLVFYNGQENLVVNNIFAANHANGSSWVCAGGAAMAIRYGGPALLHNTIVSNTGAYGVCINGTVAMTNTMITGHATGVYVQSGNAVLESTLWHNNTANWSGSVTDNHPLTGDPAFVNPAVHDYHIGATSAALDAGAISGVGDDIDGDARPADGGYDVGADERPGVALRIAKSVAPMVVNPGGSIVYTVVITSAGAANASGVVLTDTLPALVRAQSVQTSQGTCTPGGGWGATVTCNLGALNVGARAVVTLTVETTTTVPAALPARLRNVAQARASDTLTMTAHADAWLQDCHARLNNNPTDYTTVQAAVDAATQASDVVKVAGTCVGVNTLGGLRQQVYLTKTLTLRGGYTTGDWNTSDPAAHPTVLDALGLGRVVYIAGTISPTLDGLTLQNGDTTGLTEDAGGGVAMVNANATVTNCRVYSSTAAYGGGVFVSGGAARIIHSTLAGNSASSGGGLYLANDQAIATGNLIRNNTASNGGGVYLYYSGATLAESAVYSNTAAQYGGGIYLYYSGATLAESAVYSNTAVSGGGGLYAYGSNAAQIHHNRIFANTCTNWDGSGGGLYLSYSDSTLRGNAIFSNTAPRDGGGVYSQRSHATFTGDRIYGNVAGRDGGGVYLSLTSLPRLTNVVIADNQAVRYGSGLYNSYAQPRIVHATIARNSGGDGSGVYVAVGTSVQLTNTIIVSQTTGIFAAGSTTATVNGVLWYSNTANTGGTGSVGVTGAITGNPAFAADGYHLLAGSAAIDQGVDSGVTVDIDGDARPQNGVYDLGVDEYFVAVPVSHTLTIAKAGNGNGVVTPTVGAHTYPSGTVVVVTATAQADSVFSGWSGACGGLSPTCTVMMDANKWVTATFTLKAGNHAPTANAGADQSVKPGELVTLDGSGSTDPDGDPLTYFWQQIGGAAVSFTPTLSRTTFTAPVQSGLLTFTLTVTDTGGLSDSDLVVITVMSHRIYLPLVLRNGP